MNCENEAILDTEAQDEQASENNRLVILKPLGKHWIEEEDPDEAEARAEFIYNNALHDFYGPLIHVLDKEPDVRLRVVRNKDGTRNISVTVGSRTKRQANLSLHVLKSQGSASEGDSNPFDTHDFLDKLAEPDRLGWAIKKTWEELQDKCLDWDCLRSMTPERRHNLKRCILRLHDKLDQMKQARARREEAATERFLRSEE